MAWDDEIISFKVSTPPTPSTSAVREVIEQRKREKAEIEEEVGRKEAAAIRETVEVTHKDGREKKRKERQREGGGAVGWGWWKKSATTVRIERSTGKGIKSEDRTDGERVQN